MESKQLVPPLVPETRVDLNSHSDHPASSSRAGGIRTPDLLTPRQNQSGVVDAAFDIARENASSGGGESLPESPNGDRLVPAQVPAQEIWKPVIVRSVSYPYEISNIGRLRSVGPRGRLLKPNLCNRYHRTSLYGGGPSISIAIHKLVMLAFVGESDCEVDHVNAIKTDNRLDNLEYVTRAENLRRAMAKDLVCRGTKSGRAKLIDADVLEIRWLRSHGFSWKRLARMYSVDPKTVRDAGLGKFWAHCVMPDRYAPRQHIADLVDRGVASAR